MPIYLTTGAPGSGKSLFTLHDVEERRQKEGRDVYYNGVTGLMLPWIEFDKPEDWNTLPNGAIIVIDECQRFLRPRHSGSAVPQYVQDFELHRHKGYDIYLITQHPLLIDANVRRLTETHTHIMRKFGSQMATFHEWKGCKENCDKSRADSVSRTRKFPKDFFDKYKSAEIHTVKTRVPFKIVAAVVAIPCLIGFTVYVVGGKLSGAAGPSENATSSPPASAPSGAPSNPAQTGTAGGPAAAPALTPREYLKQFVPLVDGLPHTAPRYAHLTNPVRVPTIRGCWLTDAPLEGFTSRAVCMLDGGVYVYPPESFVQQYLRDRYFIDWENPRQGDVAMATPKQGDIATAGRPAPSLALPSP